MRDRTGEAWEIPGHFALLVVGPPRRGMHPTVIILAESFKPGEEFKVTEDDLDLGWDKLAP